jgi:hypothetical protein
MPSYVAIDAFDKVAGGNVKAFADKGTGYAPKFGWHIKWHEMAGNPGVVDRFHLTDEGAVQAAYYLFEIPLQYVYPGPNRGACQRNVYEGLKLEIDSADQLAYNFIKALKDNGHISNDLNAVEAGVLKRQKDADKEVAKMEEVFGKKDAPGLRDTYFGLKRRMSQAKPPILEPKDFPKPEDLRLDKEKAKKQLDQIAMDVDAELARRTKAPPPIGMTLKPGAVAVLVATPAEGTGEPP